MIVVMTGVLTRPPTPPSWCWPCVALELDALTAVDEAGARTLAAACQNLRLNGRRVEVRGLRREVSAALNRLGLVLADVPGPRRRPRADPASATA